MTKDNNILSEKRPDLLKLWDYEKNRELNIEPDKIKCSSLTTVWWKCEKGHSYSKKISSQVYKSSSCPECRRFYITDEPQILKYYDVEKNEDDPCKVRTYSKEKYWWKCENGHEFQRTPSSMYESKNRCPVCNRFNLLNYPIVALEYDEEKNEIPMSEINTGTDKILHWKCEKGHTWTSKLPSRIKNRSYCIECQKMETRLRYNERRREARRPFIEKRAKEREEIKKEQLRQQENELKKAEENITYVIMEARSEKGIEQEIKLEDSLAYNYPKLALYWNYERNGGKTPFEVNGKVKIREYWWKCEKGHEWINSIHNMSESKNDVCQICNKRYSKYHID